MKICVIGHSASIHIHRWISYFAERGHEVHLVAVDAPKIPVPTGVQLHDLVRYGSTGAFRFLPWTIACRRLITRIKPDIVHAHYVARAGWLGAATGFHPFIVTAHGSDLLVLPRQSIIQRQLSRAVLKRADYVTCVSSPLVEAALALGAPPSRVEEIRLGIDTSVFHPNDGDGDWRGELSIENKPVVLNLRAIKKVYNPLDIVAAIPQVVGQFPDARFIFLTYNADSTLLAEVQSRIEAAGLSKAVRFVEELANDQAIASLYRTADVALSTASSDGTPISVQEAMATGTPTILGRIAAFEGWVNHEENALLIPLHSPEQLGQAIVRLLRDSHLRQQLSEHARAYVQDHASRRYWMERNEAIYRKLI